MRLATYRPTIVDAARLGAIVDDLIVDVARLGEANGVALPSDMLGFIDLGPQGLRCPATCSASLTSDRKA